jgi:hypothetical protein
MEEIHPQSVSVTPLCIGAAYQRQFEVKAPGLCGGDVLGLLRERFPDFRAQDWRPYLTRVERLPKPGYFRVSRI